MQVDVQQTEHAAEIAKLKAEIDKGNEQIEVWLNKWKEASENYNKAQSALNSERVLSERYLKIIERILAK